MRAGLLDRRITLQSQSTALDSQGFPGESFATLASNVPANKREVSGTERNADNQEVAKGTTIFTIRFRSDIGTKDRVVYDSVSYDITFLKELDRKHWLELYTERRTDG